MWLNFGDEMVNMDAVSQVTKKKVDGRWVIVFFRFDGSYMTSLDYDSDTEAEKDFNNIKEAVQ